MYNMTTRTTGLLVLTVKILRATAEVIHELFETMKERIYKRACWYLNTLPV